MEKVRKIKQLKSQRDSIKSEIDNLKLQIESIAAVISTKKDLVRNIDKRIKSIENDGVIKVSEHAMLRYLERVKGISLTEIENEILTDKLHILVEQLGGTGTYPLDGFSVAMRDNTITTVIT